MSTRTLSLFAAAFLFLVPLFPHKSNADVEGDTYLLTLAASEFAFANLGRFYVSSKSAVTVTFDGIEECLGDNLFGNPGDHFLVNEFATLNPDGSISVNVTIKSVDMNGNLTIWVSDNATGPNGKPIKQLAFWVGSDQTIDPEAVDPISCEEDFIYLGVEMEFYRSSGELWFETSFHPSIGSYGRDSFGVFDALEWIILVPPLQTLPWNGVDFAEVRYSWRIVEGVLGDVNCDGATDLLDVTPFIDNVVSGEFSFKADIDKDGEVTLLDVGPFVELLVE